jgi:hypothetical protein
VPGALRTATPSQHPPDREAFWPGTFMSLRQCAS